MIESFEYHINGSFDQMTNDQLFHELSGWSSKVKEAPGWPSAYFAAKCLKHIVRVLNSRGVMIENPYLLR